jgi:amidophosphoribosyltransferase
LIACKYSAKEMAAIFGADSVGFLPLEDVTKLGISGTCKGYCKACFDGEYPTEVPDTIEINKYDLKISENKN